MDGPTVGAVGSGPALDAVRGALDDVNAAVETGAESVGTHDLGVVVAPAGDGAFEAADRAADRWIAVEVGGVGGRPLDDVDAAVTVLGDVRYAHLRARVAAAGEGRAGERAADGDSTVDGGDATADRPRGDRSAVRLAGAVAGRRAVGLLAGDDLDGTLVEVAGAEVVGPREVVPVPDGPPDRTLRREAHAASLDDAVARAERALDDRVGLLTAAGERESFPAPYYLATLADTRPLSDARAATHAAGVAADWDAAFMKALGEGLERYAAGVYREGWFDVAPERTRTAPVSPSRFARPDGFAPPDPDEPIPWVAGEDLATGDRVDLPAEFVQYPPPAERHRPAITTGLGLGSHGAGALLAGLYEVVERDATMVAWYSTYEPLELAVEDETYATLARRARAENLTVTPLLVTTDVDVPVVAVAVHRDGAWPRFAVGSAADLDAGGAARGALAEALQNWMELRAMGPDAAAEEAGAIARYADFPDAARTLVDAEGPVPAADVGPDDPPSGGDELAAVVDRVTDAGLDAYAARITTGDVDRLGFEAARVVVPGAQPLFVDDPFFAARAETVPRALGYEPRLDREYHPYP
jgi:ribosomal protein S12 methylthiotransferase accessory factor